MRASSLNEKLTFPLFDTIEAVETDESTIHVTRLYIYEAEQKTKYAPLRSVLRIGSIWPKGVSHDFGQGTWAWTWTRMNPMRRARWSSMIGWRDCTIKALTTRGTRYDELEWVCTVNRLCGIECRIMTVNDEVKLVMTAWLVQLSYALQMQEDLAACLLRFSQRWQ